MIPAIILIIAFQEKTVGQVNPDYQENPLLTGVEIQINAEKVLHTLSPRMIGTNLEYLNNQCYGGIYSQLLYGENFEEHVDPTNVLRLTGQDQLRMHIIQNEDGQYELWGFDRRVNGSKVAREILGLEGERPVIPEQWPEEYRDTLIELASGDRQVSRHWQPIITGTAKARFRLQQQETYNGKQSQSITFISGEGEVGIDNAGLNRWGINLQKGKSYEGILRVKAKKACTVYVSFRSSDGLKILAEKPLEIKSKQDEYQRISFELSPDQTDEQGRFAVTLKEPGTIILGYAFLQPGEWGRYKGLPLRKDLVQAVLDQGVKVMRYNGSNVSLCPDSHLYKWKEMIGPRDERKPYRGRFNPYASHGFAIFEFLDMCNAMNILGIPGIRLDETEQDIKDMIEYCNGPVDTPWGQQRAEDGHPEPYRLTHIQISNEERLNDHYVDRFIALGKAIWSVDPGITLLVSNNLRGGASKYIIGPDGEVSNQLQLAARIVEFGKDEGNTIWWDCHYHGHRLYDADNPEGRIAAMRNFRESMSKLVPDYDAFKLAPLEENGATCDMLRALAHARNFNTFCRMGDLPAVGVANTFQADYPVIHWDQGRTHFNASQVWFQPPYYVDKMIYNTWTPKMVETDFSSPGNAIDAIARISEDGNTLVLQVVNSEPASVQTSLTIAGFETAKLAQVIELQAALEARNTDQNQTQVIPEQREWQYGLQKGADTYTFPPYSFTIILFERK